MQAQNLYLRIAAAVLIIPLFLLHPEQSLATDTDIIIRLEKMEQEIKELRKENAELRKKIDGKNGTQAVDNARLEKMVEQDRKEIQELKKSAGRLAASNGLKAVLGKYEMQIYGRVKVDINYDTAEFKKYNDGIGAVAAGNAENDSTNFNPRDSRIGIKVAKRDNAWLSEARIETDFYGDNNGNNLIPRMRLGYVKLTNDDWDTSLLALLS